MLLPAIRYSGLVCQQQDLGHESIVLKQVVTSKSCQLELYLKYKDVWIKKRLFIILSI